VSKEERTLALVHTILAAAIQHGCVLATDNRKDFPMTELRFYSIALKTRAILRLLPIWRLRTVSFRVIFVSPALPKRAWRVMPNTVLRSLARSTEESQ
jgi:hypothetical protein